MSWSEATRAAIATAGRRVEAINAAIDRHLPAGLSTTMEHDDWPLLGWGLVGVCGRTARNVHALAAGESVGSAATLARRLKRILAR